jgi:hypothetical protein
VRKSGTWNLATRTTPLSSDWHGTWLVMRCSNKNTLALVRAMAENGVRAWTPLWVRKRRLPRSSEFQRILLPCLPSFVFLAEDDIGIALASAKACLTPGFSVMNSYGVLVRIKDNDLLSLREISDSSLSVNPVHWPKTGSHQKVISGAFQGLLGQVVGRSKRHCLVDIPGFGSALKIPPFLLSDIEA